MQRKGKLTLGTHTFSEIRDPQYNYLYVDKTEYAWRAIQSSKYIFLARPRRFGKTLFVDTLSELFKGSKELFEGLYIYDKWDWEQSYPVIRIDFAMGEYHSVQSLYDRLVSILQQNCADLNLDASACANKYVSEYFANVIKQASEKYQQKVVVLIDEYDKAIIDNLQEDCKTVAAEARTTLRSFYSVLKAQEAYLGFVFMTGVSKFTQMSIFSGLNNLNDITVDARFAALAGYTQSELETVFDDYLQGADKAEVKRWYNGYNFLGDAVYNPYDILLFFDKGNVFKNYWWQSGNSQFLVDLLKVHKPYFPALNTLLVGEESLNAFDVERIELSALLWQTGYLTFSSTETVMGITYYRLKVPNLEVQSSLNALFFDYLTRLGPEKSRNTQVVQAILAHNFTELEKKLKALFAAIPYHNYVNNRLAQYEGYYASVLYTFLATLGFIVIPEDTTNTGRIDMTLLAPSSILILEFKVDQPQEAALAQIKEQRYYEKYSTEAKPIYLLGIHFSSERKNIVGFEWELWS